MSACYEVFDPGFLVLRDIFLLNNYNVIKGWKRHTKMTMNLVVPVVQVRVVFSSLDSSSTHRFRVIEIGVDCYSRITVPPGIWFAFQGLYPSTSMILNLASITHDPAEVERLPLNDLAFSWD